MNRVRVDDNMKDRILENLDRELEKEQPKEKKVTKYRRHFTRYAAIAASFAVLFIGAYAAFQNGAFRKNAAPMESATYDAGSMEAPAMGAASEENAEMTESAAEEAMEYSADKDAYMEESAAEEAMEVAESKEAAMEESASDETMSVAVGKGAEMEESAPQEPMENTAREEAAEANGASEAAAGSAKTQDSFTESAAVGSDGIEEAAETDAISTYAQKAEDSTGSTMTGGGAKESASPAVTSDESAAKTDAAVIPEESAGNILKEEEVTTPESVSAGSIITDFLDKVDSFMYYPLLIIVMAIAGLYFTIRTRGVQIRLIPESIRLLMEPTDDKQKVSSLQAMLVSTASRVGTGNIVGVSTAICLGGPGACFWMWLMCIIGAASAFIESTLAQVYKKKNDSGESYGGPAYYIEKALHAPLLAGVFCVFLIAAYAVGFNLLCSYNLQSSFTAYSFYDEKATPFIVGAVLAVLTGYCLLGGGKRIVKLTSVIVPFMGLAYAAISLLVIFFNISRVPAMFIMIFEDAFDFKAIFSGVAGSCMIYGIKRGLYSNEAGVGSAPNASATARVSHPVKQGLVQTLSVYIDTLLLCTATALMCLSSGAERSEAAAGAPYVQNALSSVIGGAGPVFITVSLVLFGFTTLLGNLYYVDNALIYLNKKRQPSKAFMRAFHILCVIVILIGAMIPMNAAWAMADITMGGMTLINLPCCMLLGKVAIDALRDYEKQKKEGKNPVFYGRNIGLDVTELDFWK